MNPIFELCERAAACGLRLEIRGDKIAVIPANKCPPEFAEELRFNKGPLLSFLQASKAGLSPDCRPWLHIAKQVIAGEFHGGSRSLLESILIGVRSISHPVDNDN